MGPSLGVSSPLRDLKRYEEYLSLIPKEGPTSTSQYVHVLFSFHKVFTMSKDDIKRCAWTYDGRKYKGEKCKYPAETGFSLCKTCSLKKGAVYYETKVIDGERTCFGRTEEGPCPLFALEGKPYCKACWEKLTVGLSVPSSRPKQYR